MKLVSIGLLVVLLISAGCVAPSGEAALVDAETADDAAAAVESVLEGDMLFRAAVHQNDRTTSVMDGERRFTAPEGVQSMRIEISWDAALPTQAELEVEIGADSKVIAGAVGTSPIVLDVPVENLAPGEHLILVAPPSAGVIVNQPVHWKVTVQHSA